MTAIVGRAAQLGEIDEALARTLRGNGRLLLVSGPAGIGKSRIAAAAVAAAEQRGLAVAQGYAVDDPGAPPLWPWLRLMRDWPGATELPTADAGGSDAGDSDAATRFRLFTAVADLIGRQARDAGLLLVLEDMHWADRTSVLLLRHLAAGIAAEKVTLLMTCRDAVPGPLDDVLPDLLRGDDVRPMSLSGLSVEDVAAWLPLLTGASDDALAAALQQRTTGNPLLIRLVAEDLAARGVQGATGMLERLMADRPQLRRLVAARVAPLPPPTREVLEAASILGEQVVAGLVAAVTGTSAADVATALDQARAAGVLRDADEGGGLAFEHALVRDAVYATVPTARRSTLHRRAALALADLPDPDLAGSIAVHWQRADGPGANANCARWAERADQRARLRLAYEDAVRFAELALTSARIDGSDDAEQARLLIQLAEARFLANLIEASVQACIEATDRAAAAGRPDLMARAGLVVHGVGDPFAYRSIAAICERALAAVSPDDHATRARLRAQVAVGLAEASGGPEAGDVAAEALADAERSGDSQAILEAIAARHLAISIPHTVVERLALGRRAVELGSSAQFPISALWGHLWRADASFQLGNLVEAEREIDEIARVASERGSALARWHEYRYRTVRAALIGDFPAARSWNTAARDLAMNVGSVSLLGMYYAFQSQLALVRADPGELDPGFIETVQPVRTMPLVRVVFPVLHALNGRMDEARAEFEEFRHIAESFPLGVRWFGTIVTIGYAAELIEDVAVAEEVYGLIAPIADYYSGDGSGAVFNHGANARLAGGLAYLTGRPDEARTHYRNAIAMNSRIGARPFTALSRLGLARTLLSGTSTRTPAEADLAEASDLLTRSAAEFRRLDMPRALADATVLIDRVAAAQRTASPLSAREAEVASLVAEALSNKQIATRLVISERTVEAHVRNILAKLGFTRRAEITTWALRPPATDRAR